MINYRILATAGHVDHGKSSLVQTLTGWDPDRLPEEKERGLTIELGFAHIDLGSKEDGGIFRIGIVDVPGHEDFVKNMVNGVGAVDGVLLAVAADDGWMPQTEEHLQILEYLQVQCGLIALTKSDLVDSDALIQQRIREIKSRCESTFLETAPIIPCSILSGAGISDLKKAMLHLCAKGKVGSTSRKARLWVDRAFQVKGVGTVVTGSLTGGGLSVGETIRVYPAKIQTRIRSLQSFHTQVETILPGSRAALQLADVDLQSRRHPKGIGRGDLISNLPDPGFTNILEVTIHKSGRLTGCRTPAARPLRSGVRICLHLGTATFPGVFRMAGSGSIEPGATGIAQFISEKEVTGFVGDPFVIRDWSEQNTLGGGTILGSGVSWKRFRTRDYQDYLQEVKLGLRDLLSLIKLRLKHFGVLPQQRTFPLLFADPTEIDNILQSLMDSGQMRYVGNWLIDDTLYRRWIDEVRAVVGAWHQRFPESLGMTMKELQAACTFSLPDNMLWPEFFRGLEREGWVRMGGRIKEPHHIPSLPHELREAGEKLRVILQEKPFDPPSIHHLLSNEREIKAMKFLVDIQECICLSEDTVMATWAFKRIRKMIESHLKINGKATVSELRQRIGTNRRVLVPILEQMDQEGITKRQGDYRVPGDDL